jgi:hypothetical protein
MDTILRTPKPTMSRAEQRLLHMRQKDEERKNEEQRLREQEAQIRLNKWLSTSSPRAPQGKSIIQQSFNSTNKQRSISQPPFGTFPDSDEEDNIGEYGADHVKIPTTTTTTPGFDYIPPTSTSTASSSTTTTSTNNNNTSNNNNKTRKQQSSPLFNPDNKSNQKQQQQQQFDSSSPPPPPTTTTSTDPGTIGATKALTALKARKARELQGVATARLLGFSTSAYDPPSYSTTTNNLTTQQDAIHEYANSLQQQAFQRRENERLRKEQEIMEERERIQAIRNAGIAALREEEHLRREKQAEQRRFIDESLQLTRRLQQEAKAQEELELLEMKKELERLDERRRAISALRQARYAVAAATTSTSNVDEHQQQHRDEQDQVLRPPFDEDESAYTSALAEAYRRVLKNHSHELHLILPILRKVVLEPEFISVGIW